jgi:hypothetical protein
MSTIAGRKGGVVKFLLARNAPSRQHQLLLVLGKFNAGA